MTAAGQLQRDAVADRSGPGPDPAHAKAVGIWSPRHRLTSLGAAGLVSVGAFESLAVTTVMPLVSADLDGRALYSLAFSAAGGAALLGMVLAGRAADRSGPFRPLLVSIAVFAAGLLAAGFAPAMAALVAGRALQGLGAGGMGVAMYVLIARVYPEHLHPKVFGMFATAWVIPALVGPAIAGVVAEQLHWRIVFLGVLALVPIAAAAVWPAGRSAGATPSDANASGARTHAALAFGLAASVVALGVLPAVATTPMAPAVLPAAVLLLAGTALAVRPLLPAGALRSSRGLPSSVLARGLIAAAYFGTEVYVPLFLIERHGLSAATAGISLTAAAVLWAIGSNLQGRLDRRVPHATAIPVGAGIVLVSVATVLGGVALGWPPVAILAGWAIGGAGMGITYPRLTSLTLSLSAEAQRGFNSAAMSVSEALGPAVLLGLSGTVFVVLEAGGLSFAGAVALAALTAVLGLWAARRVRGS